MSDIAEIERLTADLKYYTDTYDKQKAANEYTITELEQAFHDYFRAKQKFLRIAKRYCEQHKVDEGQNGGLSLPKESTE